MPVDYQMLRKGTASLGDYQRLQEEFELEKQKAVASASGQDPASVKLANEIQKARAAGDTQRLNDLQMSAKLLDRGVVYDQMGNPIAMGGYGDAIGTIAGTKKAYEAEAQNLSDLAYDPLIAGGEAKARFEQELGYAPRITGAEKAATLSAEVAAETQKKARQDVSTLGAIERAKVLLPEASSGRMQNIVSSGARVIGKSTPKTQADAALEVVAAELVQNVPRFEGPQSNIDVQFYKDAAADVANPNKPYKDRVAALDAIQERIRLRQQQGLLGGGMTPVDLNAALPPAKVPMGAPLPPQNATDYTEYFK